MNLSRYIGIPYVRGGRKEEDGGLDCYGLVRLFYEQEMGITLKEYALIESEGTKLNTDVSPKDVSDVFHPTTNPRQGDLILFNICGEPMHIAIVLDENRMLHSFKAGGSVIEHYTSPKWKNRVEGFYEYRR